MPRLENLKQAQVLQVTNPTGVVSAASLGSAASDGYGDLSKALQNTAKVVGEVWAAAGAENDKFKLKEFDRRAAEVEAEAKAYASRESKHPLGQDKVDLYKQRFKELSQGYFDTQEDGRIKKQGIESFKDRSTKGLIDVMNNSVVENVERLHEIRKKAFSEVSGKLYSDLAFSSASDYQKLKGSYLGVIEGNEKGIDEATMLIGKDQAPTLKRVESGELSTGIVKAFVARGDFKEATNALAVLSSKGYMDGGTAFTLSQQIAKEKEDRTNKYLKDSQRGEKQSDEVAKQRQRTIVSTSIGDLSQITSAADQKSYVDMRRLDYERGHITLENFNTIKRNSSKASQSTAIKFKNDYTEAIDALNRGEDITDMVTQDLDKNKYHPAIARQLLQAQDIRDGITKDTKGAKGGTKLDGFKEAGKMLNDTKGMFSPRERLEIQEKVTQDTINGKDPVEAAKAAVSENAKKVVQKNRAAPGVNPAISLIKGQTTLEDLDRIKPMIQQEAQRARQRGQDAAGAEILRTLKMQRQLLGAAGSNEVINERRR